MPFNRNVTVMVVAVTVFLTQAQAEDTTPLGEWSYDKLYQDAGFTAHNLMEAGILDAESNKVGTVENVLLNEQDQIVAIIAQVGDVWESGDTHLLIPWEEVEVAVKGLVTPISEEKADEYGLFKSRYLTRQDLTSTKQVEDKVSMSPSVWKVSDILDEFTNVDEGQGYGYVDNVLFTKEGKVQAVVIDAAINGGTETYALPFPGINQGWAPGLISYTLPYSESELLDVPAFEYEKYDGLWS